MPQFFDSHCHLQVIDFSSDLDRVLTRARLHHVSMLTVGTDVASSVAAVQLAKTHPEVFAAVGIHPNDTSRAGEGDLTHLRSLAQSAGSRVLAIGEIGLDYYRDHSPHSVQRHWFEQQLALALELKLPVILHARESGDDVLPMVKDFIQAGGRAVWHCFSGNKKQLPVWLSRSIELGLYLGLSGMITWNEQKLLRELISQIPDRHLLLDSDSPYLLPRPTDSLTLDSPSAILREFMEKRNEPAGVVRIAEELAVLRRVSTTDIARITTRNARELLGLAIEDEPQNALAYPIRNSLYLSLTNACNNDCLFCARNQGFVVKGHDIRLSRDPSAQEVITAMGDTSIYDEVVFCGFGEPTLRLDVLKAVAKELKSRGKKVRLNTNGLANREYERDITRELVGLVDTVSVSLNTADPEQYHRICRSHFGLSAHHEVCAFVRAAVAAGLKVICSVVTVPEIDVEAARRLTASLGAEFRIRTFADAG